VWLTARTLVDLGITRRLVTPEDYFAEFLAS
jgi:hypothetical protein